MRPLLPFLLCLLLVGCATPPAEPQWQAQAIGVKDGKAEMRWSGDTLRLEGPGKWLTDGRDQFTFAWLPRAGQWEWQVLLRQHSPGTLAGVMVRQGNGPAAKYFFAGTPGDGTLVVQTRLDSAGPTYHPLPLRLGDPPLHFYLSRGKTGEPGALEVRNASGFLQILPFPDFGSDTLLVGLAVVNDKGLGDAELVQMDFKDLPQPSISLPKAKPSPQWTALGFSGVVAHRGATYSAPENSLSALEAATHCGALVLEVDVRLTADGVPVLMHDETVDRTTNGKGFVEELTWAEIRALRLRNPDGSVSQERVPDLVTALLKTPHDGLWLLDKAWPIRDQLAPLLRQHQMLGRCIFKGNGSLEEAMRFLDSFGDDPRPKYMHLVRDSLPEALKDSLMQSRFRSGVWALDLQMSSPECPLAHSASGIRMVRKGSMIEVMVSPFAPNYSAGQREAWYPEQSWMWAMGMAASLIQTDMPCELYSWVNAKQVQPGEAEHHPR